MNKFRRLVNLYFVFFKIGITTFGGGIAMLPILERELIDKRKWTTKDEMLDYYAIAQTTPGVIAVNVSTFLGYKQEGAIGGIIATLGVVAPSIVIITLIAHFLGYLEQIVWFKKAFAGIDVAVAALLSQATISFARRSIKNFFGAILFIAAFILIFFFNVSTGWVIISAAVIGIVESFITGKDTAKKNLRKSQKSEKEKNSLEKKDNDTK